jgi:hypothetical protein
MSERISREEVAHAGAAAPHRRGARRLHRPARRRPRPRGRPRGPRPRRRRADGAPGPARERPAADDAGPVLAPDEVLAAAPSAEDGQFRVPPVLGEGRERHRHGHRRQVRAGDRSAVDVLEEHLERIAEREPEIHAFNLLTEDQARAAAAVDAGRRRAAIPARWPVCPSRSRTTSAPAASRPPARRGSSRAGPALRRHGRRAAAPRRRGHGRQDQPGRVRDGLLDRELGVRPDPQPPRHRPGSRVAPRAGPPLRSRPGSARSRSDPTPAARSASPLRCAGSSGSSRPTAACPLGLVAFGSSLDQVGPFATTSPTPRWSARSSAATTRVTRRRSPRRSPSVLAHLDDGVDGLRVGVVTEMTGARASPPTSPPGSAPPPTPWPPPAPRSRRSRCRRCPTACPPTTSWRRPRRRATWPATTACATGCGSTRRPRAR